MKPIKLLNYDGCIDFCRRCFGKGAGNRCDCSKWHCNLFDREPKRSGGGVGMFAILVFIGMAANVLGTICGGSDGWSR